MRITNGHDELVDYALLRVEMNAHVTDDAHVLAREVKRLRFMLEYQIERSGVLATSVGRARLFFDRAATAEDSREEYIEHAREELEYAARKTGELLEAYLEKLRAQVDF